ncbi:hypothetical protein F511_09113 [Dorcoceras hygrometricum]|uniref:Dystroglycan-like n=1 Tax=Dorcoceras hygrometricum TaxID=472368 RepID=A0A2Z7ALU2_9LAMI|nr:hypothetical protein F511_09113 [Dorcoceras hygrometricum]
MASSLISNTIHILFDSVLAMDNADIVEMFEALVASGLKEFLGCPAVIYEFALIEFFQNGSVRYGMVVSTIQGKIVHISEEVFASTFEFPVDGLIDMNEIPKDLGFDASCVFSFTAEQLRTSCKKREMKIEFQLLSYILVKSITVKAGSFDAVTHERLLMMAAINGGVKINWGTLLFNIFKEMVTPGSRQARGYAVQIILLRQMREHKLEWARPSRSSLFEGGVIDGGFFIQRNHRNIFSKCWIRVMILVDGSWLIVEGVDYWRPTKPVDSRNWEMLPQRLYFDDLAPLCSSLSLFKTLILGILLFRVQLLIFLRGFRVGFAAFSAGKDTNSFVGYFSDSVVQTVLQCLPKVEFVSSDGSTFYRPSPISEPSISSQDADIIDTVVQPTTDQLIDTFFANPSVRLESGQHLSSQTPTDGLSSSDQLDFHIRSPDDVDTSANQLDFPVDTPAVGTASALTQMSLSPLVFQLSLPTTSITIFSESFADLKASVSRIIANQATDSRRFGDSHGEVLSKINHLEKVLLDTLYQQDQAFRILIQSVRQEAHNDTDVLSLALKSVRAQNSILSTDLADVHKEVKDHNELLKELDERLATVRSDLLDFRAQAQENHLNLSTQLGFLVDYINQGGDAKKGEDGSSRPQPPPDDQNRPSG